MIDVADFMFANPAASRADIIAHFHAKLQISQRTFDVIICDARKYNAERIRIQENAEKEVLSELSRKDVEKNIISREDALNILSTISKGECRAIKDDDGRIIEAAGPTDADRIRAITQLAKMQGWEAPAQWEGKITNELERYSDVELEAIANGE